MRVWDMPDDLYCALRFQQDPSYTGPNAVYANLICLTNRLLRNSGIGDGPSKRFRRHCTSAWGSPRRRPGTP